MKQNEIEKQVFTYPFLFRLIFRYGNFVLTSLLAAYSIPFFYFLDRKPLLIFPLLVNLMIIYFLNKHYFNLYKILPFNIEADVEKIVCSNLFLSKKEVIIYYTDISSLSGGIFSNKNFGLMKIRDGNNNVCIGFYQRLNGSQKLESIILSKVKLDLYDQVIEKINSGIRKVKQ